ncbi:MAG: DNA mismatch repair protein MutS, partial [Planctomycetes bacterium]|nr:DNA mismatch repair protein MutS [Planctomycetota bacterium]
TCWPEALDAEAPRYEIEEGKHPLLPADRAVGNTLALGQDDKARLLIVTGSNMAGKSTFLKMSGLSLLLAQTGAPVPARAMRWTPLAVDSDINVRDSLDDGRSYFAVEVDRVLEIIQLASTDAFRLALIDEIFRGTNTREKVAAGVEVARQLATGQSLAILATHDMEFTQLEADIEGGTVRNAHFSDDIRNGSMAFDYRLEPGPARGSNAIRVLAHAGYPEDLVRRALERSERSD